MREHIFMATLLIGNMMVLLTLFWANGSATCIREFTPFFNVVYKMMTNTSKNWHIREDHTLF